MSAGELLTRVFVWIALAGYAISALLQLVPSQRRMSRWLWVSGAIAFLLHVCCAFHFFHNWSHADAFEETARQTKALTGFESGSGLYLNYAFTLLWFFDAGWWLAVGDSNYFRRPHWIPIALHSFFLFMFVNGAVVFGKGPVRWYGITVLAMMLIGFKSLKGQSSPEGKS